MFKKIKLQRMIQGLSLVFFLGLLTAIILTAAEKFINKIFSLFLMLDPLSALSTSVAARTVIPWVGLPLAVVLVTAIFGRVFCGYICPMGITVDLMDGLRRPRTNKSYPEINRLRFILLTAVLMAAVLGVNVAFHLLPVSLATRLYGLLAYPFAAIILSEGTGLGYSAFGWFNYFTVTDRHYASLLFLGVLSGFLFYMSGRSRRFWCRYICPSGAFLGLLSLFSPYKRRVTDVCIECGKCERDCPVYAIKEVYAYNPQTCISCKKCVNICPVDAISFEIRKSNPAHQHGLALSRREALGGVVLGTGATFLSMSELHTLLNVTTEHGAMICKGLIRPPGAVPEQGFLARCIRCGQCMVVCPTNGLQPLILQSGSAALFSPVLVPRRGKCVSTCNMCGVVCPTGAIQELTLDQKQHAKIGTARVIRERCLAWNENRSCMVCHEVCPYNAMHLDPEPGYTVTVPKVNDARCFGCGACEHSCPPEISAVEVEPYKELRLDTPDYIERSKERGLELTVSGSQELLEAEILPGELPPGFVR